MENVQTGNVEHGFPAVAPVRERLVTRGEVARVLGCSVSTIQRYERRGLLRGAVLRSRATGTRLVRFRLSVIVRRLEAGELGARL